MDISKLLITVKKMIKKLRKILPIAILISIGLGVMQANNQFMVQGVLPIDSYIGETMSWNVENITSGIIQWWNGTSFTFQGNWTANIGDSANFTISDSKIINEKTYLEGLFKIGNHSLETNNYDIGFNLAFSCYPWYGGLVSLEQNWNELSNQLPFNGTKASITTDLVVAIPGKTVAAVRILYDDAFQTSEFFYEQETGILLSAETNVGFFWLKLVLNETSISLPTTTGSGGILGFGFITTITTVVIGCISLLLFKKKRR